MDNTKTEKTEKMDFDRTVLYSGAAHMNFLFDPAEYAAPDGFEDEGSFICICSWCRKGYPLDIRKGQFVSSHEWEGRGDLICPLCGHDAAGETFSLWKNEYSSFPWFMGVKRAEDGRFRISFVRMRAYPVINRKTVFLRMVPEYRKYMLDRSGTSYCSTRRGRRSFVQNCSYVLPEFLSSDMTLEDRRRTEDMLLEEYKEWSGRDLAASAGKDPCRYLVIDNRFGGCVEAANDFAYFCLNPDMPPSCRRKHVYRHFNKLWKYSPEKLLGHFFGDRASAMPKAVKRLVYKDPLSGYFLKLFCSCGVTDPKVLGNLASIYGTAGKRLRALPPHMVFSPDELSGMYGVRGRDCVQFCGPSAGHAGRFFTHYVENNGQEALQGLLTHGSGQEFLKVMDFFREYECPELLPRIQGSLARIWKGFSMYLAEKDRTVFDYSAEDRAREVRTGGYDFRLPEDSASLVIQGEKLKNCLGRYTEKIMYDSGFRRTRVYTAAGDGGLEGCIEISSDLDTGCTYLEQFKGPSNSIAEKPVFEAVDAWMEAGRIRPVRWYSGIPSMINTDYLSAFYNWMTGDKVYCGRPRRPGPESRPGGPGQYDDAEAFCNS